MFQEACFDNSCHFQLVLSLENAIVFGVKQGKSFEVFKGDEQFNENNFADVKHVYFVDVVFEPGIFFFVLIFFLYFNVFRALC